MIRGNLNFGTGWMLVLDSSPELCRAFQTRGGRLRLPLSGHVAPDALAKPEGFLAGVWRGAGSRSGALRATQPVRRVQRSLFGVLALESEPVDPRL